MPLLSALKVNDPFWQTKAAPTERPDFSLFPCTRYARGVIRRNGVPPIAARQHAGSLKRLFTQLALPCSTAARNAFPFLFLQRREDDQRNSRKYREHGKHDEHCAQSRTYRGTDFRHNVRWRLDCRGAVNGTGRADEIGGNISGVGVQIAGRVRNLKRKSKVARAPTLTF